MVALVHFSLLARIKVVNSDPRVRRTTGHESVTQVRVERSGCDGVRKRDGNWRVLAENVEEMNILARCNAEGTATVGEFHARDGFTKVERGHLAQCSKVPPSENRKKLVLRHCRRSRKNGLYTHRTLPSSAALTPIVPFWPSSQTRLLTMPSQDKPSGLVPSTRGSASGRPRSKRRIFFSCPPYHMRSDKRYRRI